MVARLAVDRDVEILFLLNACGWIGSVIVTMRIDRKRTFYPPKLRARRDGLLHQETHIRLL